MKSLQILLRKNKVTILVSVFVILSALLISTAATASTNESYTYELTVDQDLCIGCGLCEEVAPIVFIVIEEKAYVVLGWEELDQFEFIIAAIDKCPMEAIWLTWY